MTRLLLTCLAATALIGVAVPAADAANARRPYTNVDRSNDRGNSTGDRETDRLNEMQLNQNYRGPTYQAGTEPPAARPMR